MKSKIAVFLFLSLIFSCKSKIPESQNQSSEPFVSVVVDTLFKDKVSIRAILVDKDKVWYAADKNRFGFYDLKTKKKWESKIITKDTLQFEFRSIAQTSEAVFVLSVANPAVLYKISKKDLTTKLVYQENNEKVFYDSMQFWNNKEGIAIGDPTEDCFSIITTRDGGNSWNKISCENLPKLAEGEAFFAASNTNIIIKGAKTFIVSGGKKSRIFVSDDKGLSWKVYETPIVQGESMTGIFSADFYNEKTGFAVGGNYEKQSDNSANKAITIDGGKTWKLSGVNEAFGYASCIQFVPHKKGKELVTVGTSGIFYSSDQGRTWIKTLEDKDLYTLRFQNDSTAFAAGRNKIIRINFKQ
jgi:photosystem II stability/assembly factor-like uncharacterized protein